MKHIRCMWLLVPWCVLAGCVSNTHPVGTRIEEEIPVTLRDELSVARPMQFAIVADRTGGHRDGVFEDAMAKLNLLQPDFVLSVGDLIEGYTTDPQVLDEQWDEFSGILNTLERPFFHVPGNHDLSNDVQSQIWQERLGRAYYAFVRDNCLFLCLNTEDPLGGHLSQDQLDYMADVLARHDDVEWTFVLMHEPLWLYGEESGWSKMETLLGNRDRTVIAGHFHTYTKHARSNHEYIVLGTTGGGSPNNGKPLRGVEYGEFDHVVWITMVDGRPRIANLLLEGIRDTNLHTADTTAGPE